MVTGEIIYRSQSEVKAFEPSIVFILTGLCSLTAIDKTSRIVKLHHATSCEAVISYEKDMLSVDQALKSMLKPKQVKVIFATIIGMDICRYNRCVDPTDNMLSQQATLNESVRMVNSVIVRRNSEFNLATPWLQRLVHRYNKGKVTNSYFRLDNDGCHLSDFVLSFWAKELDVAIRKNTVCE